MEFRYYIGVDVSKNKLDVAVFRDQEFIYHQVIGNNGKEINRFLKSLKQLEGFHLSAALFCMEHTGIYNNPLLICLHKKGGHIWLEAATQIKNSLGNIRGKNDNIDAKRIGAYAYKNRGEMKLWTPKRDVVVKLEQLTTLRDRLINTKKQLTVLLKEQKGFINKSLINLERKICQRTLTSPDQCNNLALSPLLLMKIKISPLQGLIDRSLRIRPDRESKDLRMSVALA